MSGNRRHFRNDRGGYRNETRGSEHRASFDDRGNPNSWPSNSQQVSSINVDNRYHHNYEQENMPNDNGYQSIFTAK